MSINDNLPKAAFDKIEFPYTRRSARFHGRHHVHEFPRMAGGALEKMGRGIYEFTFEVPFHDTIPGYTNLYPDGIRNMQERCDRQTTATLLIPEIGTIRAVLVSMDRTREARIRSGENATLTFKEDDLEPFKAIASKQKAATVASAAAGYATLLAASYAQNPADFDDLDAATFPPRPSLFSLLSDAANAVGSIRDQGQLFTAQLGAQLATVARLCREIHDTVAFLGRPDFAPLAQGIRALWDAVHQYQTDLDTTGQKTVTYVVPKTQGVGSIATTLYGTASRGTDILRLNSLDNPFAVPAGTRLLVYPS
jgi:DNA circularisation protein N-terminus